jgi:hypothetical protein
LHPSPAESGSKMESLLERLLILIVRSVFNGDGVLTVYFGAPSMFITLWFGFDYGTNPPLGTLII